MWAKFWGTRGSIAKAGPSTLKYGGNTSCVEVRTNKGTVVVIDCGTGAHGLGQNLTHDPGYPVRGHLFISHTHWDHIQGLPFFAPLFVPGNKWDIYAPRGLGQSLQETLAGQMQYTYFPVSLQALGATIKYHDLVEGRLEIDDLVVHAHYLNHPGLTLGYRFEADGASVVYACDHEPHSRHLAHTHGEPGDQDASHVDFLKGASLVIHDAQYTETEYANKVGWGHSTVTYALNMCVRAGVQRLALTHHDPLRDDEAVDEIVDRARKHLAAEQIQLDVFGAEEGMRVDLDVAETRHRATPAAQASAMQKPAIRRYELLAVGPDSDRLRKACAAAEAEHVKVTRIDHPDTQLAAALSADLSLILLDAGPGTLDWIADCRKIRAAQTSAKSAIPLVVIADKESIAEGRAEGVTDWLLSPFTPEYARTRLRAWVLREACRWQRAPMHANEDARIAALQNLAILDTKREDRFDRITRIAAATFNVPMALVSMVDKDRQWFKSAMGLGATETPRDRAFCAHAIVAAEPLQVPDAMLDPRFADNPLVTGDPRVRFYAGCPVTTKDGLPLGTLCLLDTRPRILDEQQLGVLKDLAGLVSEQLRAKA